MLSEQNLPHTNSTEKLMQMMERFFDFLNVTRYTNHSKKSEFEPNKSVDNWMFDERTFFQTLNISHLVHYKSHITGFLKILFSLIS